MGLKLIKGYGGNFVIISNFVKFVLFFPDLTLMKIREELKISLHKIHIGEN